MKKFISTILTICAISTLFAFSSISVSAANYSTTAAMNYAANHWNDGVGQCAEFVSKCVQAGGLNISTQTGTKGCWNAILNATGLSGKNLALDSYGYVTKNNNGNILNRGDVVIQWCYTCDLRPHILICGGYDSSGYATFYAHNSALNNGRYKFSTNKLHKSSCNIGAKVVQLSKLSSNTSVDSIKKPTLSITSYPTSIKKGASYGMRGSVAANGANTTVKATVTNSSGKTVLSTSDTVGANSTGNIQNMNVNNKLTFNTLSAGTYTLKIVATNSKGSSTFSKNFTVTSNTTTTKSNVKKWINVNKVDRKKQRNFKFSQTTPPFR